MDCSVFCIFNCTADWNIHVFYFSCCSGAAVYVLDRGNFDYNPRLHHRFLYAKTKFSKQKAIGTKYVKIAVIQSTAGTATNE